MPSFRVGTVASVLEARAGVSFAGQDVYLNVAGGVEPVRGKVLGFQLEGATMPFAIEGSLLVRASSAAWAAQA